MGPGAISKLATFLVVSWTTTRGNDDVLFLVSPASGTSTTGGNVSCEDPNAGPDVVKITTSISVLLPLTICCRTRTPRRPQYVAGLNAETVND